MKLLKFLMGGAAITALLSLSACNDKEPNSSSEEEYDEAYYAANAYITSDDSNFTSTDDGGTIDFKAAGGSVSVVVVCGVDWTVQNSASDQVTAEANTTGGTLVLTAPQNTKEEEKTTTITLLTSNLRIQFATITVTQNAYGAPEITVETNEWNAPAKGALSTEIGVESSLGSWTVENDADWLTVESTSASVILTAAENEEAEERSVRITLTADDGYRSDYETIRIYQDAKANIDLSTDSITLYDKGESASVAVDANFDWDYSYDSSNGFFTISRDDDNLTVTITADNETSDDLSGVVTITAGDGAENVTETQLTVILSASQVDALILDYTVSGATSMEITLPLVATVNCTVSWGDGSSEEVTSELPSHTYAEAGSYTVRINGTVSGLSYQDLYSSKEPNQTLTAVEQWGHTGLKTMDYAFYYCMNLKSIPTDPDGVFADVTNFTYTFWYCNSLTAIPDGLFNYATKVTAFTDTFGQCTSIKTIPEDLFKYCTEATDFTGTFRQTDVSSIPENIFQYNTKAECMDVTFYYLPITSIPENIFSYCPEITSFSETFECCSDLKSIPENLFKYNTKAQSFKACFYTCNSLTEIPAGLFDNCPEVTTFYHCFAYMKGSTPFKVPAGLFKNNKKVETYEGLFMNCTTLTGDCLPAEGEGGIFAEDMADATLARLFYGCSALDYVPSDFFKNCTNVTDAQYLFYQCTSMKTITPGIFDYFTSVTAFNMVFSYCSGLTAIPENLFANCKKVDNFQQSFRSCTALTGESAYDVVEINGVETKIHLYERSNYPDIYNSPSTHSSCYYLDTGLSDYSSIISGWK